MKKLPKVFANSLEKELKNNLELFDSRLSKKSNNTNVRKEIDKIFKRKDFVYKSDIDITMKDKNIRTSLVGKNNTSIFTLDGQIIPINEIIEIKKRD